MNSFELPPRIAAGAIAICTRIRDNGGRAYLVGGCVRDMAMRIAPKDFDMEVFGIAPEALRALFPGNLFPTGRSFGIYKYSGLPLDVGIPRRESAIGTGHRDFEVFSDPNLSLPLAASRRDFTVNAIYWDPLENRIEDPFNGMGDMEEKNCAMSRPNLWRIRSASCVECNFWHASICPRPRKRSDFAGG
jgi:tRNA nucleotidyltransferase (CCA-adding enzyme)